MHTVQDQALFSELLADLRDADAAELLIKIGSFVYRNGSAYFHYRTATGTKDTALGKLTPTLEAEIKKREAAIVLAKEGASRRAKLVAQLRTAGYLMADNQTGPVLNAIALSGAFRQGLILVGTHAFRCYGALLGTTLPAQAALTRDIDIARARGVKVAADRSINLLENLRDAGDFLPAPPTGRNHHTARYFNHNRSITIDVLTARATADLGLVELAGLGTHAQPVRYLEFLMVDPQWAAVLYRGGILVQVPAPERFALHKLIVSQRRQGDDRSKAHKDLLQADALIQILGRMRPEDLGMAWDDLKRRGRDWEQPARNALQLAPEASEVLAQFD